MVFNYREERWAGWDTSDLGKQEHVLLATLDPSPKQSICKYLCLGRDFVAENGNDMSYRLGCFSGIPLFLIYILC